MNKAVYFVLGTVLGAAGGSAATYFITKARLEELAADEIDEYAQHCEDRIERIREEYQDKLVGDLEPPATTPEEEIDSNEGVKKYHHNVEDLPEYASKRVFKKTTKEEEMATKKIKNIKEITEEEFLDSDREKQTIDVLFRSDDTVDEIWGYQTDNQTTAEARFGKKLIDLIGIDGEDLLDWVEADEGTAVKYFSNMDLNTLFEIVVHCDPETYYEKENKA